MTHSAEVRLRGHHLVCLQFFRGEGYSAAFVENLAGVIERSARTEALVVVGADDVCAACPGLSADGTCVDPNAGEPEVRRLDALACEVLGVLPGERLSLAEARVRLAADETAAARWRLEACGGCTWEAVCEPGWDPPHDDVT
jgi:uncharacterized protein